MGTVRLDGMAGTAQPFCDQEGSGGTKDEKARGLGDAIEQPS